MSGNPGKDKNDEIVPYLAKNAWTFLFRGTLRGEPKPSIGLAYLSGSRWELPI